MGAVVEEMIGLAAALIPEVVKTEPKPITHETFEDEVAISNIQTMKGLLEELKQNEAFTSCPACMTHLARIEEELGWAEERVPTYQKAARLRSQLKELYELVKPGEAEFPPIEAPEKPALPQEEETRAHCLECALNATLDAKRLLREAQAADDKDRYIKRLLGVKEELQHAQYHLSDKFPELATKVRSLRKVVDPIILKGEMVKPLPLSVSDLESVETEILALAQK